MINVAKNWNPKQALLKELLNDKNKTDEALRLCLELHSLVHSSEVSKTNTATYDDILWDNLSEQTFRVFSDKKKTSIAWNLWHITRIEDITANILIANGNQVLDGSWLKKLNTNIHDTGNAMSDQEIINFSNQINMQELRNYRTSVGKKTQEIIRNIKACDLKRKMNHSQLDRIINEGGVLKVEGSIWLIDFWGKKNVAGILLMPITRHQIVHLNDALRIKEKYMK